MSEAGEPLTEVLKTPVCGKCGYQVPNDCASGASCPMCHERIYEGSAEGAPPPGGAPSNTEELAALRARVAELEGAEGINNAE